MTTKNSLRRALLTLAVIIAMQFLQNANLRLAEYIIGIAIGVIPATGFLMCFRTPPWKIVEEFRQARMKAKNRRRKSLLNQ
jgi:hypothetical protein